MLREQTSRLTTALKRALGNFDSGGDDPITTMKAAIELAVREDEDVLTALVFERLRYLPESLAWGLVVDAATVLHGERPHLDGPLVDEMWPPLVHPDTGAMVEPDVVWRAGRTTLGIEVKWKSSQSVQQLDREYKALLHRDGGSAVAILALGGATDQRLSQLAAECVAPSLLSLDWSALHRALGVARLEQKHAPPTERLLDDIMAILAMRNPLWARAPLDFSSLPGWKVVLPLDLGPPLRSGLSHGHAPEGPEVSGDRAFCSLPSVTIALSSASVPMWRRQ